MESGAKLRQWACRVHNTVNRRLNKPVFNCDLVDSRWAPLDCEEHDDSGCSLQPLGKR